MHVDIQSPDPGPAGGKRKNTAVTETRTWTSEDGRTFTGHLQRSVEQLLGGKGDPTHPGRKYIAQLARLGREEVLIDDDLMGSLAQALLDRATWANYPPEQLWEAYGGERVRGVLQPRLVQADQYFDALAELRLCGQIRQVAGLRAEFETSAGQPDLYLRHGGEKVWIEAKHLRTDSSDRRLSDIIYKAGKQFKKATSGNGAGAVHISIGAPVRWHPDVDERHADLANDVARRILTPDRNRSVAQAVISWDDYVALEGDRGTFCLIPRRRARMVRHPNPRMPALIPDEYLGVSRVNPWIISPENPPGPGSIDKAVPHRSLPEKLRRFGLSWPLVQEALRYPKAAETFELESTRVLLAITFVKRGFGRIPILAGAVAEDSSIVSWVYPLPQRLVQALGGISSSASPLTVLFDLVQEFGLETRIDDQYAPMIVLAHPPGTDPNDGRYLVRPGGRTAYVDYLESARTTHVVLLHAFDADKLHGELIRSGFAPPRR